MDRCRSLRARLRNRASSNAKGQRLNAVGDVTKQADGRYKGCLNTVSIKADIDVLPYAENTNNGQLAFRVVPADIEIGAGWMRKCETSNTEYVSLSIAAPESGLPELYANLGQVVGSEVKDFIR